MQSNDMKQRGFAAARHQGETETVWGQDFFPTIFELKKWLFFACLFSLVIVKRKLSGHFSFKKYFDCLFKNNDEDKRETQMCFTVRSKLVEWFQNGKERVDF